MKIHLHQQGIFMLGKAWEIKGKLQEYSRFYETVADWITDERVAKGRPSNKIIEFPLKNK